LPGDVQRDHSHASDQATAAVELPVQGHDYGRLVGEVSAES
jgi:hypothetical protein